jgi:chemosensory pili system protein ChpA (sensor histidine kinase/response regulator)
MAGAERMQAGEPFAAGAAPVSAAAAPPAPEPVAVSVAAPIIPSPMPEVPEPALAPVLDQTVVIGDIRVSRGLYTIFVDEAGNHLAAMKRELALLESEPQPPRDELVRAAHTLAGIAGTVNFKKLNELGRAFERMLLAAKGGGVTLVAADLALAQETASALAAMVEAVRELRPPPAADQLEMQLEIRRAEWAGASDEADPLLAGFVLPTADAAELARPAPLAADAPAPEIDFAALSAQVEDDVPAPAVISPTQDFSFDVAALSLEPAAPAEPAPELPADFSFRIEDMTLPPMAPSAEPVPAEPELSLRFIDASAPPAAAQEARIEMPDLGDRTILVAASGALDSIMAEAAESQGVAETVAAASRAMPTEEELRARGFDTSERRQERLDDEIDEQLLPIFLEEANELMPRIGEELRAWADGGDALALQRSLHTLKGSARMAGAMALGQLTHSMETRVENALQLPTIPPAIFEGLFSSFDRTTMLVEQLKGFGPDSKTGVAEAARAALAEDDASKLVRAFDEAAPAAAPAAPASPVASATAAAKAADDARAMLRVRADVIDRLVNEAGEVAIARSRIEGEVRAIKSSLKDLTENLIRLRAQLREIEIAAESQMQSRQREVEEKHASFDPLEFDRFSRFQEITRMMAESVNDVATVQQNLLKNAYDADAALLFQGRLSRDLQNDLMRVRMVPFNNVAERLYRVVRQTAKELGKRANLDIKGTQTEIDRSVLERMTGPFEHLLRNAIAHGLEAPADRVASGKTEIGQIGLSARQEGNEFVLVLEDDGRGLDIGRIRARAVANGLMADSDQLADSQIAEFIFASGFSTATEVSEVSGRGVGMDVVRAEVTALGGRVEIDFTPGKGSRFTIYLPLTLAVTQVVLIRTGVRVFAVPSAMVEQVRQIKVDELDKAYAAGKIEWLGRDYSLHFLPRLLGDAGQTAETQRFTPVLLLRSGTQRAAIHVDEMIGNQEVVVKNIGPQLARVSGIAGATVLGTGQIVLILNPVPLVAPVATVTTVPVVAGEPDAVASPPAVAAAASPVSAQPTVMVVDDSLTVRKITSRLLSRENYQVLTAKDGVDALEQLQDLRPDVMLVDVEMPRMDGFDLTRNVRGDDKLRDIPIIMITSRTADKHRNYAMEIGVNVFLGKPYQEEELLEHIAFLVKNRSDAAS